MTHRHGRDSRPKPSAAGGTGDAGTGSFAAGGSGTAGSLQHLTLRVLLLAAWLPLTGCLSRPALIKQSFAFPAPPGTNAPASKNGPILAIRRLTILPPFDSQSLVYRTGEFSYERDPYAEFLAAPAESLGEPIRAGFRESAAFASVVEPGSALRPNLLVEITVSRLYGDFRPGAVPAAVLQMRFVFFEAPSGMPTRVRFQKDYAARVPFKRRTAASLVAGWNEGLKQILGQVVRDLCGNAVAAASG